MRLLIIDDHAGFRESASVLLDGEGISVVGSAATGEEGVSEVTRLGPDVVLLDIHLPGVDGFATAERLAVLANPPAVILISSRARSSYGSKIDQAPVRGFLPKHELSSEAVKNLLA